MGEEIAIRPGLSIPEEEVAFRTSPSSGPGGQNVNKVETRVTLLFEVDACSRLSGEQKALLGKRLSTRISKAGVLRLVCQRHRSQAANRREVIERFARLLAEALTLARRRRPTRASKAAKERRLEEKRHRARVKRGRMPPSLPEE